MTTNLTPYEFTRINPDRDFSMIATKYLHYNTSDTNLGIVASRIVSSNPNKDLRKEPEYLDAKFLFIELTMSCDESEAKSWIKSWLLDAIGYGIETKDHKWMLLYLAAHDIYKLF